MERVRYIEESPPLRVSPPRETIYIDNDRGLRRRRVSRYEEEYLTDNDSEVEYIPRRQVDNFPVLADIADASTLKQAYHFEGTIVKPYLPPTIF